MQSLQSPVSSLPCGTQFQSATGYGYGELATGNWKLETGNSELATGD
jgi:hypothetical protein